MAQPDSGSALFTGLVDLAAGSLGGRVLDTSDDFFASKDNLVVDKARALEEVNADYSTMTEVADTLLRHGVEAKGVDVVHTPGAFEIPLAAQRVAATKQYDGIIALGCVIRGATPHFDYVAGECVKGIAAVALKFDVPIAFGVLTVDTIEQAVERAGTKAGNKGAEAAMSALEMVSLLKRLG